MASVGQALMARDKQKSSRGLNSDLRGASNQAQKRSAYGGVGRGLLSFLGGVGGATIGMPWLGTMLGSGLGDVIGKKVAGEHKDIQDQDFYTDQVKDAQVNQSDLKSGEKQARLARMVRDGVGAYMSPEIFNQMGAKMGLTGNLPQAQVPDLLKPDISGMSINQASQMPSALTPAGVPSISGVPPELSAISPNASGLPSGLGGAGDISQHMTPTNNDQVFNTDLRAEMKKPSVFDTAMQNAGSPEMDRGLEFSGRDYAGGSGFDDRNSTFMAGNQEINLPTIQESQHARSFPRGSADSYQGAVSPFEGTAQQNTMLSQALGLDTNRSIVDQLKALGGGYSKQDRSNMFADFQRMGQIPYR